MKWLVMSARERRGIGMSRKMAIDIIDSYNHQVRTINPLEMTNLTVKALSV